VIEAICSGKLPLLQLRQVGIRLYAEARVAIQVKLPERLRICPIHAEAARRFWCEQLADESGSFEPGHDHASLLAPACLALGVTRDDLEAEYERYLHRADYLRQAAISIDTTLSEAALVYVEEAILAAHGNRIADALRSHYGVAERDVRYFRVHAEVDVRHSSAGLKMICQCAKTPAQQQLVLETATRSLENFPIWAQDLRSA
jgi:pyrroloquinoline quinone (PQQ) biosynthesis protein C